ncbi:MAG: TIGR00341 family protein [Rhodospirillales bacterium]|nr:TIGR00341 family protein [Rhodospirillales bacterium]MCB9995173.1 TIGR00341 family protein [Rhodospirillales bacterium]
MPLRSVEIIAPADNTQRIKETAEAHHCLDTWQSAKNPDGRRTIKVLIHVEDQQELTDDLQRILSKEKDWRIIVQPVEATIPRQEQNDKKAADKIVRGSITREELYNEIEKGARTDFNFVLLVILSTIVCAIGLIKSNVAVIIGAMVIAPLLGPNLALAFGAALGERKLIFGSIKSNIIGLGLTLGMAVVTGIFLNIVFGERIIGPELLDRTHVGYDSIALALAAGAAAVLSLTTGLSSTLVGVMVAVALMPPAVTLGLMLGMSDWDKAYGATLLLAANIVSISIAAQLVFVMKGFKPRTWYMRKKSKQSAKANLLFWGGLLLGLMILIALHH